MKILHLKALVGLLLLNVAVGVYAQEVDYERETRLNSLVDAFNDRQKLRNARFHRPEFVGREARLRGERAIVKLARRIHGSDTRAVNDVTNDQVTVEAATLVSFEEMFGIVVVPEPEDEIPEPEVVNTPEPEVEDPPEPDPIDNPEPVSVVNAPQPETPDEDASEEDPETPEPENPNLDPEIIAASNEFLALMNQADQFYGGDFSGDFARDITQQAYDLFSRYDNEGILEEVVASLTLYGEKLFIDSTLAFAESGNQEDYNEAETANYILVGVHDLEQVVRASKEDGTVLHTGCEGSYLTGLAGGQLVCDRITSGEIAYTTDGRNETLDNAGAQAGVDTNTLRDGFERSRSATDICNVLCIEGANSQLDVVNSDGQIGAEGIDAFITWINSEFPGVTEFDELQGLQIVGAARDFGVTDEEIDELFGAADGTSQAFLDRQGLADLNGESVNSGTQSVFQSDHNSDAIDSLNESLAALGPLDPTTNGREALALLTDSGLAPEDIGFTQSDLYEFVAAVEAHEAETQRVHQEQQALLVAEQAAVEEHNAQVAALEQELNALGTLDPATNGREALAILADSGLSPEDIGFTQNDLDQFVAAVEATEAEALRVEQERIAAERAYQEAEQARLAAEQAAIEAHNEQVAALEQQLNSLGPLDPSSNGREALAILEGSGLSPEDLGYTQSDLDQFAAAVEAHEAEQIRLEQERIWAEQEAARLWAEQEAARIAAEEEAARIAAEQEAARIAAEQEAARLAAEEAARIAAEQEAARRAAAEAARIAAEQEAARQAAEYAAMIAAQEEAARQAAEEAAQRAAEEAAAAELAAQVAALGALDASNAHEAISYAESSGLTDAQIEALFGVPPGAYEAFKNSY